ncbi:hypothetical protein RRG08_051666 [Elysia crispata]|uniref:Uncharacterized protein n=1 Tax=Elysia crispata TaxID=231223 RepID=A0AAE1A2L6_9GAST|nr:hypothetical protein RRG08_051666 [Elysia crispata]
MKEMDHRSAAAVDELNRDQLTHQSNVLVQCCAVQWLADPEAALMAPAPNRVCVQPERIGLLYRCSDQGLLGLRDRLPCPALPCPASNAVTGSRHLNNHQLLLLLHAARATPPSSSFSPDQQQLNILLARPELPRATGNCLFSRRVISPSDDELASPSQAAARGPNQRKY